MFEYLKKYIGVKERPSNFFEPVTTQEIEEEENRSGLKFPDQLKRFWQEIGCGFLNYSHVVPTDYETCGGGNRICSPGCISDTILLGTESFLMTEEAYSLLKPGELPFFEITDAFRFLIMDANSDTPNAVYTLGSHIKIEDSLEKFIWRLYYESADFYDDIITKHYENH